MSSSGYAPWEDDDAADWFHDLHNRTGLAEAIAATLQQEVDPVSSREIRAAAYVLICLGRCNMWPLEFLDTQIALAIHKLEEYVKLEESGGIDESARFVEIINKEIELLKLMQQSRTKQQQFIVIQQLWSDWLCISSVKSDSNRP